MYQSSNCPQDEWNVANSWRPSLTRNSRHPRFGFPPLWISPLPELDFPSATFPSLSPKMCNSTHRMLEDPFKVYNFQSQAKIIPQRGWKTSAPSTLVTRAVKLLNPAPPVLNPDWWINKLPIPFACCISIAKLPNCWCWWWWSIFHQQRKCKKPLKHASQSLGRCWRQEKSS